jgi:uncharacterized protein (TIGR02996 family)
MATDLDALLEAIREAPADDLPRLALSDWCMEQTCPAMQARGEWIQARVRSAALPANSPERGRLEQRVQELRQQHEPAWLGGLAPQLAGWDFERGMLLVEVTRGFCRRGRLARLARLPDWKWVIGLKGILLDLDDVTRLIRTSHLVNLTSLDLSDCDVGSAGVRKLAQWSQVEYLAALRLGYAGCGDIGSAALAKARADRLTVLALYNNRIGPAGARSLAGCPHLGRLARLDLSRNPLGDEGARVLAGSAHLPRLTHLALSSCGLEDRGAAAFIDSTQRDGLEALDLTDNRLSAGTRRDLRERYGPRVLLSER